MAIGHINKIEFGGYKSIVNVDLKLQPGLNIVIGPNGSGKTNFMEFLYRSIDGYPKGLDQFFLKIRITYSLRDQIFETEEHEISTSSKIVPYGKSFKRELDLEYRIDGAKSIEATDQLELDGDIDLFFEHKLVAQKLPPKIYKHFFQYQVPQSLVFLSGPGNYRFYYKWGIIHGLPDTRSTIFERYITDVYSWEILNHLKKELVEKKQSDLKKVKVKEQLSEKIIQQFYEGACNSLNNKLAEILTEYTPITDVRISDSLTIKWIQDDGLILDNILLEFKIEEEWYRWDSLSDGTKRLLLMITSIHYYDSGVLLIEEPEVGIHPHQLDLLMKFLSEESSNKQIIITTHSPQVLDTLEDDEIDRIIIAKYSGNQTVIRNIDTLQIEKAKAFTKDSFLSDFWRHTDELKI